MMRSAGLAGLSTYQRGVQIIKAEEACVMAMTSNGDGDDLWRTYEAIIEANQYLTLATADQEGTPWASPVWFATRDSRCFVWASKPGARHSLNLASRPEVAISIFDSSQTPGTGAGVYLSALASQVPDADLAAMLEVYSTGARRRGLPGWTRADVDFPARHRLYRAIAHQQFVLDNHDERVAVSPI